MGLKIKSVSASGLTGFTEVFGWTIAETAAGTASFKILDGGLGAPSAPSGVLAGAGAGNIENGNHALKVTYVTADGETPAGTASASVNVADKTTDGKITWTIPTASGNNSSRVTARKLYRTEAGGGTYKLLATVSDNSTTTYLDNVADGGLGANAPSANNSGAAVALVSLAANGESVALPGAHAIGTQGEAYFSVESGSVSGGIYGQ